MRTAKLLLIILPLFVSCKAQVRYEVPGRTEYCKLDLNGISVLPSGRYIQPEGQKSLVTRAPYGLAVSPDGKLAVILHSNAISVVRLGQGKDSVKRYPGFDGKGVDVIKGASFIGAAFSSDCRHVYLSGGDRGKVWVFDAVGEKVKDSFDLNAYHPEAPGEAFATDLILDEASDDLWVLDRAWNELYRISISNKKLKAQIPTGRIPFGLGISPDKSRIFIGNVGIYSYALVPGVTPKNKDSFFLHFPPFGAHTKESWYGDTAEGRFIPGLGDPNDDQSMSVWIVNTKDNVVLNKVRTGHAIGSFLEDMEVVGGAHPNSIVCSQTYAYVSQTGNDNIAVIEIKSGKLVKHFPILSYSTMDSFYGYLPYGLELDAKHKRLYVALLGYNAVAVLNSETGENLGMIPGGWGPTRVKLVPESGNLLVTSARGIGAGPNGGKGFVAPPQGTYIGDIQLGLFQNIPFFSNAQLVEGRKKMQGFTQKKSSSLSVEAQQIFGPQSPIKHIVYITKENRTYDEVFGQIQGGLGDSNLSRFGVNCEYTLKDQLKHVPDSFFVPFGLKPGDLDGFVAGMKAMNVAPNHIKIATQFAMSDNFYCDGDASIHGHHWMIGTIPNEYVETNAANSADFRPYSAAPGRRLPRTTGAMDPEDYNQTGGLWEALERKGVDVWNFGEANEYTSVQEEWYDTLNGTASPVAWPMPAAIYQKTSRNYAGYNTSIPDQFRVEQFETEFTEKWLSGKDTMPPFLAIQLPNDHTSGPRPEHGYPFVHSYVADNDLALGRMLQFLSQTPYWKNMLVVVTEDDAQGGMDHIDAHRSLLFMAGPWVKKGYVSHTHANFGSILHTMYAIMQIPPVNQYDATATLLDDWFTLTPDFSTYSLKISDPRVFDPEVAMKRYNRNIPWREVKMSEPMDDEKKQREEFYEND